MQYIIGTRGSALALAQSEQMRCLLAKQYPMHTFTLQVISTKGDRNQMVALDKMDAKGIFVKEIEEALLEGSIHIAVHSMKDMPTQQPTGLCFTKTIMREDARDVFISRTGIPFAQLPAHAIIGTGSKRRKAQLLKLRPDLQIVGIRGNVDTRLRKMETEKLDGIVLAAAGLKRLQLEHIHYEYFPHEMLIPACGQGALAVEVREDNHELLQMLNALANDKQDAEVAVERSFLKEINGGCHTPVGAYCQMENDHLSFSAVYGDEDCQNVHVIHWQRQLSEANQLPKTAAQYLIEKVKAHG